MSTDTLQTQSFRGASTREALPRASRVVSWLAIWIAVAPLVALPCIVLVAFSVGWPRWVLMWTLAIAVYGGCKWITWCRMPTRRAPLWRHVAYLVAWPGMDAAAFLDPRSMPDRRPRVVDWLFAVAKLGLGFALLLWAVDLAAVHSTWLAAWIGIAGIAMSLHFGAFDLLSLGWRAANVNARGLMNWPLASTSIGEHWGRRWNTAFRDLMFRFVFRPALGTIGPRGALLAVFLASGLVHDLVISVPAEGGYGGPTLFFAAQAAGALFERSALGQNIGLGRGPKGWLFTMLVLLIPLPLLFPPPFMTNIVVPMLRTLEVAW